jgi:hypothetical protein
MSKAEFDGISEGDLERFKELLVRFYGKPWEDSYSELTREIEKRLLRKDINVRYRSYFVSNIGDLIMTVVARFIKINSKLQRDGKEILNFYAMLENRIGHVYHEVLRALSRPPEPLPDDDSDLVSQTNSAEKEMEEKEARLIKAKCYRKCLNELPPHVLNIFLENYGANKLPPAERTQTRLNLALRIAEIPAQAATPEEFKRAKNNLDSMISKWRTKHLEPCMDKCLKQKTYHL